MPQRDTPTEIGQMTGLATTGLSAATSAGVSFGTGAASTALGVFATAAPFVGIGVGVYELLRALGVGKGCGESCIQGAEYEQVFEAAAENISAFARHGLISKAEAISLCHELIDSGQNAIASAPGMSASRRNKSAANMVKSINGVISGIPGLSDQIEYSGADPRSLVINPLLKGWYAVSLQKGNELSLSLLAQAPSAQSDPTTQSHLMGAAATDWFQQRSAARAVPGTKPPCSYCKPLLLGGAALAAKLLFF